MLNIGENRLDNLKGLGSLPSLIALNVGELFSLVRSFQWSGSVPLLDYRDAKASILFITIE